MAAGFADYVIHRNDITNDSIFQLLDGMQGVHSIARLIQQPMSNIYNGYMVKQQQLLITWDTATDGAVAWSS